MDQEIERHAVLVELVAVVKALADLSVRLGRPDGPSVEEIQAALHRKAALVARIAALNAASRQAPS